MPRCAVLDANGVFVGMEEVDNPTDRHLPQITECDLPPGEYVWHAHDGNACGGEFLPLPAPLREAARAARKG